MKVSRLALVVLAAVVVSAITSRTARAGASYDLCLGLNGDDYGQYFMSVAVQGHTILVGGTKGHGGQDDHGPLFGAISQSPQVPQAMELGLTVTFANAGDYLHQNTEHVVFTFLQNGTITFKRWVHTQATFTEGTASVIQCQ